ncbi:MAG: cell division protein FtsL [Paracoccaceae bacterium]
MRNLFFVLGMGIVIALATWSYRVNYRTRDAMDSVASLQREIASERQTIAVLRAEWAYLNRPKRLLALSEEHFADLRLMPLHPDHFAGAMNVAYPSAEDPLLADLIEAAVAQVREEAQ